MAFRIEENAVRSGEINNTQKGRVEVTLVFTSGVRLHAALVGNTHRDLAGRVLRFRHPSADLEEPFPDGLTPAQLGSSGDITASRKVKIPTVPNNELHKYYKTGLTLPTVWKNSLYLEWFSDSNGRVVLEATAFELTISEPMWEMTEAEENAAGQAVMESLEDWLDQICNLDEERKPNPRLDAGLEMNEHQYEKFLRSSDRITDRYQELIDKFGIENEEEIHKLMGWDKLADNAGREWLDIDATNRAVNELMESEAWKDEEEKTHPLQDQAAEILSSVDRGEDSGIELWGAVATVTAKLAGALAGHMDEMMEDAGFTIAQLKRCLKHIDEAVKAASEHSPAHVQPLLALRQNVIDLQQVLRRKN